MPFFKTESIRRAIARPRIYNNGGPLCERNGTFPDEAIVVGTTARLVPVKDIPCLLQGFSLTLEKTPNLRLLIVGDGPERRELEKLTGDLDIREYVVFAGFRQDIPECLAAMDIYINTSRSEGQPISLMEAMASQKPVIVTEVGGMKEMITAGKTGLFIPPERPDAVREAIQRLVQNPSLMQKLGANGKALIEAHYSRKTLAESHVKLYEDLIKGTLSHVE